jgi:putative colanic acid biosynthesis acetyltransferase WcaF
MKLSRGNRLARGAWNLAYWLLFRFTPTAFHFWRRAVLRCFGARVGRGAHPYPRCRIWAPWNLTMGDHSCLANGVDCYSVAPVALGDHAIVSQYSYICTASHDYNDPGFPLVARPISIGPHAWIAASAFLGPGVGVGRGAVVGAGAVVVRDVEPWAVVAGNPARFVKWRYEHQHPDSHPQRREEPVALS